MWRNGGGGESNERGVIVERGNGINGGRKPYEENQWVAAIAYLKQHGSVASA